MTEHQSTDETEFVDLRDVLDKQPDPMDLAASHLGTAAQILRKSGVRRLDSMAWRVADALLELGEDLPRVHRPTRRVAKLESVVRGGIQEVPDAA